MKQMLKSYFRKLSGSLFILFFIGLQACQEKMEIANPNEQQKGSIRFDIQIASHDDQVGTALGKTHRNTSGASMALSPPGARSNFTTNFSAGDSVGVFAVPAGQPLAAAGNLIHNAKLVFDGTTWSSNANWDRDIANYDFYAYYPYNPKLTDPINFKFEVKQDQRTLSNFSNSDLMVAKISAIPSGATVGLTFHHALSLIQVEVPGTAMDGSAPDPGMELMLNRLNYSGTYNLFLQRFTTSTNTYAGLRPYRVEQTDGGAQNPTYTYRALVPPQTIEADQALIFMTLGKTTKVTKQKNTLQMMRSNAYSFTVDDFPTGGKAVLIKAGIFMMGNGNPGAIGYELPLRLVEISKDFYMSKNEVTLSEYVDFLNANYVKNDPSLVMWNGSALFFYNMNRPELSPIYDETLKKWKVEPGYEQYPMTLVFSHGALSYCNWVGGKLPTEAQWEYACRAGSSTTYFFGNDIANLEDYAWIISNSSNSIQPVGQKLPNNWGLYDMYGNVEEMTLDRSNTGVLAGYPSPNGVMVDPGEFTGEYHVVRGGSYRSIDATSSARSTSNSMQAYLATGFRVIYEK